jgi:hypothetical protein
LRFVSDEPGVAGEQQGDLVRRLRAVVEAKDAEIGVLRGELAAERELRAAAGAAAGGGGAAPVDGQL